MIQVKYIQALRLSLILLALGLVPMALQAQTGILRGSVIGESGEPLISATVAIPSIKRGAYTNEDGLFSIGKLPQGSFEVKVTYLGKDTLRETVIINEGKVTTVSFTLAELGITTRGVDITDESVGKIDRVTVNPGVTKIKAKDINLIPSLGTPDLAQYISVLPGVVTTGDQGGQLYIRGGTPIQNMVLLDGAIIYSPFHTIGLFSIFDTDYLRDVDVYSAAFPAEYGGRVSSVMDIRTRTGNMQRVKGKVNLNPIASGMLIEGPIKRKTEGSGGSSFLLSARRGYLDMTSQSFYNYVNDTAGLPFNFTDVYGKLTLTDGNNQGDFFGFFQDDNVEYGFPTNYNWSSYGGGTLFRLLPTTSNVIISGNFAFSGFESSLKNTTETFPRRSLISGFNGGLEFAYITNEVNELIYGFKFLGFRTDYAFTNSFGLISRQQFNNTEAIGNIRWKKVIRKVSRDKDDIDSLTPFMVIEPGLHVHFYNDHSFTSFEPRFRYKVNFNRFSLSFGTGLYSQNLISATSDRDVVTLFQGFLAAPENVANQIKRHTLQTAAHALVGAEFELVENLATTVEGWYKDFTQLTNINRDKLFPEDPDFITETGQAYGMDVILKYNKKIPKKGREWYAYGTYGLAKVTRDDGTRVYPTIFDRRHNLNIVLAFKDGLIYDKDTKIKGRARFYESKWEYSLRFNLGSGLPFTQTQAFFEEIDFSQNGSQTNYTGQNGNLGILYADEINGGRLPYFHRLDLAVKRRWQFKNKLLLETQLNLINVYNRKNIFYFDRIRFTVVNQLPILPTLGVSLKF